MDLGVHSCIEARNAGQTPARAKQPLSTTKLSQQPPLATCFPAHLLACGSSPSSSGGRRAASGMLSSSLGHSSAAPQAALNTRV